MLHILCGLQADGIAFLLAAHHINTPATNIFCHTQILFGIVPLSQITHPEHQLGEVSLVTKFLIAIGGQEKGTQLFFPRFFSLGIIQHLLVKLQSLGVMAVKTPEVGLRPVTLPSSCHLPFAHRLNDLEGLGHINNIIIVGLVKSQQRIGKLRCCNTQQAIKHNQQSQEDSLTFHNKLI